MVTSLINSSTSDKIDLVSADKVIFLIVTEKFYQQHESRFSVLSSEVGIRWSYPRVVLVCVCVCVCGARLVVEVPCEHNTRGWRCY